MPDSKGATKRCGHRRSSSGSSILKELHYVLWLRRDKPKSSLYTSTKYTSTNSAICEPPIKSIKLFACRSYPCVLSPKVAIANDKRHDRLRSLH